ncbi:MAG: hypothetical protein QOE19_487, partial [Actinomycetota bacterium]|nr:hypothetical protein [Actinomycetota bacterium]
TIRRMEPEQALTGGNVTTGLVRIGDTVRRPAGSWTPAIHALLVHLHDAGFPHAPRSFGLDDEGRHVVEFIPGDAGKRRDPSMAAAAARTEAPSGPKPERLSQ